MKGPYTVVHANDSKSDCTSLFTDASALRRVGTTSSSIYCLADMAATSDSEWVGGVEDVAAAAGTVIRGFLTAGGSAVSEMKWTA